MRKTDFSWERDGDLRYEREGDKSGTKRDIF